MTPKEVRCPRSASFSLGFRPFVSRFRIRHRPSGCSNSVVICSARNRVTSCGASYPRGPVLVNGVRAASLQACTRSNQTHGSQQSALQHGKSWYLFLTPIPATPYHVVVSLSRFCASGLLISQEAIETILVEEKLQKVPSFISKVIQVRHKRALAPTWAHTSFTFSRTRADRYQVAGNLKT